MYESTDTSPRPQPLVTLEEVARAIGIDPERIRELLPGVETAGRRVSFRGLDLATWHVCAGGAS